MVWTFVKTTLLIGILTGILYAFAYVMGFSPIAAISFAAMINLLVYWFSDRFVLMMGRGRVVNEQEAPQVYAAVRRLTAAAGTKMPKVALVNSPIPNAFATGRSPNNATVAVHTGLLNTVDEDELEAVLAHELTHVRNWDTLTSTIAATIAGAISYLAYWGRFLAYGYGGSGGRDRQAGNIIGVLLMMVLAPLAAMLVQMAVSRTREYAADEGGATLSGKPGALASALQKIDSYSKQRNVKTNQTNPAMASLYIINPFRGSFLTEMFSTHPATQKRIARLQRLADLMGLPFYAR